MAAHAGSQPRTQTLGRGRTGATAVRLHQHAGYEPELKEPTMIFLIRRLIRLFKQRKQQQGR